MFLQAKKQPLKGFEEILVFYKKPPTYNPQNLIACNKIVKNTGTKSRNNMKENGDITSVHNKIICKNSDNTYTQTHTNYPRGILKYAQDSSNLHPTQKPLALCEYLINTYSNPNDTILDNACGSGSSLLAAKNTMRQYIGIENNIDYYNISKNRLL